MSIFKKPFAPKKAPTRKNITISPLKLDAAERAREFGLDYGSAYLKVGDHLIKFDRDTGDWIRDGASHGGSKDVQRLQKVNQQLQEENNLLKVKFDLLIDMTTEIYCEKKLSDQHQKQTKK